MQQDRPAVSLALAQDTLDATHIRLRHREAIDLIRHARSALHQPRLPP
jgi:hypothetical protein